MKNLQRGDLVVTDGPTPTHYIALIHSDREYDGLYIRRRGTQRGTVLDREQFLATHEWDEDHQLAGAWIPKA